MNDIAEIGEFVQYNGELQHTSPGTQNLMKKYLISGSWYEVKGIEINYGGQPNNNWYMFHTSDFWYPVKWFKRNPRESMIEKYNLR